MALSRWENPARAIPVLIIKEVPGGGADDDDPGVGGSINSAEDNSALIVLNNPTRKSSLVYTPTIHKKRRRALRALFSDKSLQVRGLFLVNKSKEASTCRREAAALTVQCLPRAQS